MDVTPGVANFLLVHIGDGGPDARELIRRCRESDLFMRDASVTAPSLSSKAFRIAVKDPRTNAKMLEIIEAELVGLV